MNTRIGGPTDVVGSVVPGLCSGPVSTRACVAGNGGVRSPEESPRIPVPSGGHRRGEDRTGEGHEPHLLSVGDSADVAVIENSGGFAGLVGTMTPIAAK